MDAKTKKIITWVAIAFVLFFVLSQPQQAAGIVQGALGLVQDAGEAAITFTQTLFA